MPQLPSGRQVTFDPAPLAALLAKAYDHMNLVKIMSIDSIQKIMDWYVISYLVTPEEAHGKGSAPNLSSDSLPLPEGLVNVSTDVPLSRWEELAVLWSKEDKLEMQSFLNSQRFKDYMENQFSVVKKYQQRYTNSENLITRMSALMWKAGCHPDQDEGAEEIWGDEVSPEWDSYDMLAAIGNIATFVATHAEVYEKHANAFDRATGMWQMLKNNHPFLKQQFDSNVTVREVARAWREEKNIDQLPGDQQTWLRNQMVIECVNLWNHAGETLERCCPKTYAIITLVTLSPDGANCS